MPILFHTLSPQWPQIPRVRAYTILADSPQQEMVTFSGSSEAALRSKRSLSEWTGIREIRFLSQVHGDTVATLPGAENNEADAAFTETPGVICAMRTADCLPVVFASRDGHKVAVAHAGWKGLNQGILLRTLETMHEPPEHVLAWIGPAIAQQSYETGPELREAFLAKDASTVPFFKAGKGDRWFADLAGIARHQLEKAGIPAQQISGGTWDTFTGKEFHSYRRDGAASGRMLTLAWIEGQ